MVTRSKWRPPTAPWKSRWMNPPLTIRYGFNEKRKKLYEQQHQTAADFFDKLIELKQAGAYIDAEHHKQQMARIDKLIMEHEAEQVRNALDDDAGHFTQKDIDQISNTLLNHYLRKP